MLAAPSPIAIGIKIPPAVIAAAHNPTNRAHRASNPPFFRLSGGRCTFLLGSMIGGVIGGAFSVDSSFSPEGGTKIPRLAMSILRMANSARNSELDFRSCGIYLGTMATEARGAGE